MTTSESSFGRDSTIRWSTRGGDYVMWVRCVNLFGQGESAYRILDFWELRDGDFVTITNRPEDLPVWFELHPTEVRNALAHKMMARLNAGHSPGVPADGPNLWRARSGDRLVWVGGRGSERTREPVRGLLSLQECALVIGESSRPGDWPAIFGAPSADQASPEDATLLRCGFLRAVELGLPRSLDARWGLG
jgi:hypothetical protein